MNRKSIIWQNYEIDPFDLVGKTVSITVVTNEGPASNGLGWAGRHGNGHYYFGVIESIHEHRGKVYLDEPSGDWASEALSVDFSGSYPFVHVALRGGWRVAFNPEKDAARFEWVEDA